MALAHPRTWPIWDVVFPPLCAVCGRDLSPDAVLYCAQCWADAPVADARDLRSLRHVDMVRSGFRFFGDDVVKAAVHALKYEGAKILSRVMAQRLLTRTPTRFVEVELIWTDVPLHWRRRMIRGFNQSRLLADDLAAITGHSHPVHLLRRVRHTPTQTSRTYRERAANVKDAFAIRTNVPIPKHVLLIDDVITTGATIDECARTLKAAGVEWVGALSFALAHQSR
jgi:ComF family protein